MLCIAEYKCSVLCLEMYSKAEPWSLAPAWARPGG